MESISNSFVPVPSRRTSGGGTRASGVGEACRERLPLPWDWPVYVTHEEASAFAAWTGKRLPTEAEFHRAAYGTPDGEEERTYPWGDDPPDTPAGKLRREPMGSYSRDRDPAWRQRIRNFPTGRQRMGVDVDGLPALSRIPALPVLSRILGSLLRWRTLCAQRGVLADGRRLLRRSFRNWFRPNFPYVYAGFRCVED